MRTGELRRLTEMTSATDEGAPLRRGRATWTGDEQRVRYTLDLTREQHRFLKRFAFDAELDASVVMRALLELLKEDPQLSKQLLKRLGLEAAPS